MRVICVHCFYRWISYLGAGICGSWRRLLFGVGKCRY